MCMVLLPPGVNPFAVDIYVISYRIVTCFSVTDGYIHLQAPSFLYIGQAFQYSPENAFYIFNQQIYFII